MEIINNDNIKTKQIIFNKPDKIDHRYKIKVSVIDNNSAKKIANKLVIISPMLELQIGWQSLKYSMIKFSLEPFIGQFYDFYNVINSLENLALEHFNVILSEPKSESSKNKKNKYEYSFKSCLIEDIPSNDLFLDEESTFDSKIDESILTVKMFSCKLGKNATSFDHTGKKIDANKLNIINNTNYKFLIELSELWFDTNSLTCGVNFNIVQIKYYPLYYEYDLMTQDEPTYIRNKPQYLNNITSQIQSTTTTTNFISSNLTSSSKQISPANKPLPRPVFTLDANMLKKTLGALKKISDN